jgi:hypothetical protein
MSSWRTCTEGVAIQKNSHRITTELTLLHPSPKGFGLAGCDDGWEKK